MNKFLSKIIDKRQLVSVMNKTKWSELCESFSDQGDSAPQVRYKMIDGDDVLGFSKVCWYEFFHDSVATEWVDFNPLNYEFRGRLVPDKEIDISAGILEVLNKYNIPYSVEGKYYRVWGYLNADDDPVFV